MGTSTYTSTGLVTFTQTLISGTQTLTSTLGTLTETYTFTSDSKTVTSTFSGTFTYTTISGTTTQTNIATYTLTWTSTSGTSTYTFTSTITTEIAMISAEEADEAITVAAVVTAVLACTITGIMFYARRRKRRPGEEIAQMVNYY